MQQQLTYSQERRMQLHLMTELHKRSISVMGMPGSGFITYFSTSPVAFVPAQSFGKNEKTGSKTPDLQPSHWVLSQKRKKATLVADISIQRD